MLGGCWFWLCSGIVWVYLFCCCFVFGVVCRLFGWCVAGLALFVVVIVRLLVGAVCFVGVLGLVFGL